MAPLVELGMVMWIHTSTADEYLLAYFLSGHTYPQGHTYPPGTRTNHCPI